jgi:hypothetical protein
VCGLYLLLLLRARARADAAAPRSCAFSNQQNRCPPPAPRPRPLRAPQSFAKQLEEENQLLTANFNQLKSAQAQFAESAACMGALAAQAEGAWCRF